MADRADIMGRHEKMFMNWNFGNYKVTWRSNNDERRVPSPISKMAP